MQKISIRVGIGSTKIGDVIPGVGTVEDVFAQGDKDIRICRHGDFGTPTRPRVVTESVQVKEQVAEQVRPKKAAKMAVASQKKNKQILDQSPTVANPDKQLLRG